MKLVYRQPNIFKCCGVTIMPGLNILDDEDVAALTAHPAFKGRVEMGHIEMQAGDEVDHNDMAEMVNPIELRKMAKGKNKAKASMAQARLMELGISME